MTDIAQLLETAGLTGRGGAGFSTAIKLRAAKENGAELIVNACDGEVGAIKDAWIVAHHLHELIEGAGLVADGRRPRIRYAAHRGSRTAQVLEKAGLPVLEVPHRYVSSEETALISLALGGLAKPLTKRAPFVFGGRDSHGRRVPPTVVLNAETVWRISQISHLGPEWFRSYGTTAEPGPRLVAVGGYVARPGVYEGSAGVALTDILDAAGGLPPDARHVGVGGLGGVLLTAAQARTTIWDSPGMKSHGGALGPGIVTVWNPAECPIEIAAGLISYGAGESAGQCGPCMFGLPALAADWADLARNPTGSGRDRLALRLGHLERRGACAHPDGVARFATSALRTLAPEFAAHANHTCQKGRTQHAQYA
ncbi:MAG TPA: NADH-ubiquinone oxidoreductase-F iron-sulfur binding region domain-containing protein [Propionicimonas sp.]|jgi:NADH:ubiquinone oxidoreductase subunit F (NADH-binding)|uniref:NADH-ubiquinone oxidoreductase-F iron-sulfur binding region domain-containing protein n=1 Tax=Propionicimonas sp. TaxID=1955623 RepID=UPI002F3F90F3